MTKLRCRIRMVANHQRCEPLGDQGDINGKRVTWNPDDNRFYISLDGSTLRTFAGNAAGWAATVRWATAH